MPEANLSAAVVALVISLVTALVTALIVARWSKTRSARHLASEQQGERARLHGLIDATAGTTGETYFYALVRELALFVRVDALFLASCCDDEEQRYQSLAYWCDGSYIMNQQLSLQHGLCGESGSSWYMENAASELFPDVSLFRERFPVSGFFAIKLQDSAGRQIGLLAGLNRGPLHPAENDMQLIKLFAARAASALSLVGAATSATASVTCRIVPPTGTRHSWSASIRAT